MGTFTDSVVLGADENEMVILNVIDTKVNGFRQLQQSLQRNPSQQRYVRSSVLQ